MRRRDASDLDACVRALTEVHAGDGYPVDWPEHPGAWLNHPSQFAAWVAERDGVVVGHIALSRSGEGDAAPALWSRRTGAPTAGTAVIGRLFVAPGARGHRVGARLMEQAVRDARERALHPVLDVVTSDTAAVALYERLGWSLLGTVDQQWGPARTVTVHCYAAPARG
ncbi:GNAT family N-acetyltransferase [Streptomyces sp. NPDC006733]|uniref:GNAT family N-acetyltransferase n=1 Tax=Streptomyces sp. NPDC006733 TaxID=3155460 RepID=UPI0033E91661